MTGIDGRKRFIIAVIALSIQSITIVVYTCCAIFKLISLQESLPLLSASVVGMTAIAGGYLGVQTITDIRREVSHERPKNC